VNNGPLVRMVAQRHEADCAVACLGMFLGVSYEDALIALGGEVPSILRKGALWSEMRRAAAKLGVPLVLKRKWGLADEGILCVKYKKGHHVVVLRQGLIFDTDYRVWALGDFYAAPPKAPFGSLLVREDS
jgi:hypothetical protein